MGYFVLAIGAAIAHRRQDYDIAGVFVRLAADVGYAVLKRLQLALCCFLLLDAQALRVEARDYELLPFFQKITQCQVDQTVHTTCVITEVLVLKPNDELVACTVTVDIGARAFKFSAALSAPSCQSIQCSRCDLIPSIPPKANRLSLFQSLAYFHPLTIDAVMYWGINEQTGLLTVCAIDPSFAECQSVRP